MYRYGLKEGEPRIGFIPSKGLVAISKDKDVLIREGTKHGECYHAVLVYSRELTRLEMKNKMDYLGEEG